MLSQSIRSPGSFKFSIFEVMDMMLMLYHQSSLEAVNKIRPQSGGGVKFVQYRHAGKELSGRLHFLI